MENPEQTTMPTLDKVAAALAELGQETAAAIAARAGVGYSTATKKLRVLEEAGQAEPYRADDGRTLWRPAPSTAGSTDGDDASASTPDAELRDAPAPPIAEDGGREQADEPSTPAQNTTGQDDPSAPAEDTTEPDEPTADQPDDGPASTDDDTDRPTPHDPPGQPDDSPTEPTPAAEPQENRDEPAEAGSVSDSVVATVDETDVADPPASTDDSASASAPAEDPNASTDGSPRRSKGTLRGAILDVLEAHPDQQFKTSELCQAIDRANEGSGSAKASAGAVVNAVHKLVADNRAIQVVERPAAFQLAPKTD
ncbi:MarR family transcriptional regulator [Micromonospora craniellae]|uniref:MarR family transcriptional regulator n=1 Tax=Micromonospora craniellae TaxID=2294034 RepID=A0A372FTU7_9ACTN|nr:MarR family transcriptional regulator [Micromonospora craniellae]QOC89701.1 MarR family transcriptional regulator [Micromonospora craniellae]RFS44175.1 MarR family transcriptional regulator [Micromonospora craniellae]